MLIIQILFWDLKVWELFPKVPLEINPKKTKILRTIFVERMAWNIYSKICNSYIIENSLSLKNHIITDSFWKWWIWKKNFEFRFLNFHYTDYPILEVSEVGIHNQQNLIYVTQSLFPEGVWVEKDVESFYFEEIPRLPSHKQPGEPLNDGFLLGFLCLHRTHVIY